MGRFYMSGRVKLGLALGVSSLASVILYVAGDWGSYDHDFIYMIWNLALAWTALLLTLLLERTIHRHVWSSWYALLVTLLWLGFLPNTFYMITDYIHVQKIPIQELVQGAIMLSSFIFTGVFLGLVSLYIVHWELLKRVSGRFAASLIGLVILICSFAIYIGRELRWNTWDIVTNPASVLVDVSDRLVNIQNHPKTVSITLGFFVFITAAYLVMWFSVRAARQLPSIEVKK